MVAMYLLVEHLLVVLGVMIVALAMILALQQRRSPQSSVAWILSIVLVPYVALPLFLLLGVRKRGRRFAPIDFSDIGGLTENADAMARTFAGLGAPAPMAGNRITLHLTPERALAELNEVIDRATQRLDILLYIIERDDSGRAFVRRLTEKARQGVEVRLNIDRLGTLSRPRRALAEFVAAGGKLQFFSPFLNFRAGGHLNLRNHRKLVIADGTRVWAGGRNVGDVYLANPGPPWLDLSFTAEGPVVRAFADVFAADWGQPGADPAPPGIAAEGPATLQLVPAGPDERLDVLHDGMVSAIHRAEARVWIATPYFIPTEALSLSLTTAARRGVDVRIFLPDRSNQWTADLARGAYLREAARAGCRICRFLPGMLHAKAGLIDGVGWVGSANFDVRSMLLNFETALFLYDPAPVAELEGWFASLQPDCAPGLVPSGAGRRLMEGVFRLGAPIL
jgi:cardiolipin synthase